MSRIFWVHLIIINQCAATIIFSSLTCKLLVEHTCSKQWPFGGKIWVKTSLCVIECFK